jgi:hypothetical protein
MSSASLRAIVVALNIAVLPSANALVPVTLECNASSVIKPMPGSHPPPNTKMVVLDISTGGDQRTVVNRIFSLSGTDADTVVRELRTRLLAMLRCFPDSTTDVSSAASPVVDWLDAHGDSLAARSSLRWISTKGDKVEIYLLRSRGRQGRVDVKEDPRSTRLSSDFVTLAELAQKIVAAAAFAGQPSAPPIYSFTYREFVLAKTRATLKVVGSQLPEKTSHAVPDTASNRDTSSKPDSLTLSLITGPKEHFFLSANVANTTAHQFKYDETKQSLQPVAKPKEFFVGIDYTIGDILDDSKQSRLRSFRDGLYVGLTLEGSSRPFNQLGVSLGFRHNPLGFVTFDAVSPYIAIIWARSDRLSGSPASPNIDYKYGKGKVVYGLSLNLDKALGWVSSK